MKSNKDAEAQWKNLMKDFLQDASLKAFGKHLGPFAAFKREEAASSGAAALSTDIPFDERGLIAEHVPFLAYRLKLDKSALVVELADNAKQDHASKAQEAQPLKPAVVYDVPAGSGNAAPKAKAKAKGKAEGDKKPTPKSSAIATITDLKKLE